MIGQGKEKKCFLLLYYYASAAAANLLQPCPTPNNPMDYSLQGSSIHGIFQARVLEWVATAFSIITMRYWILMTGKVCVIWLFSCFILMCVCVYISFQESGVDRVIKKYCGLWAHWIFTCIIKHILYLFTQVSVHFSSVHFSCSVISDSLPPHGL